MWHKMATEIPRRKQLPRDRREMHLKYFHEMRAVGQPTRRNVSTRDCHNSGGSRLDDPFGRANSG